MHTWVSRLGWVFLILGVALLSPLASLLPLEFEPFLRGASRYGAGTRYYRVVASSGTTIQVVPLVLAVFGALLIVSVRFLRLPR